ncbi:MAG: radical SAM protein [Candidatus Gracilibacteria bacterium]|nr:radical SAM protein [Candidatus Gracilibacteria bacterium]
MNLTQFPLFNPDSYNAIYTCLNGKGSSCIKTREITTDKVLCALKKIGNNTDVISGIVSKKESMNQSLEEEYKLRLSIVNKLSSLGIDYPFEKIKKLFHVGTKVKIREDSSYYNQNYNEGVIGEDFFEGIGDYEFFTIKFSDGEYNYYRIIDLDIVNPEIYNEDNENHPLFGVANEPREVFLERIVDFVFNKVKEDNSLIKKLGLVSTHFSVGDEIVMNGDANNVYTLSTQGSEGVIDRIENGVIYVKFSLLKGNLSHGPDIFDIEPKYMINKSFNFSDFSEHGRKRISQKINNMLNSLTCKDKYVEKSDIIDTLIEEKFLIETESGNYLLNKRDMIGFISPELSKVYQNREIYSPQSVLSLPPAESQPHVLMFELTQGCNYNKCTYCDLYKDTCFTCKTKNQFKGHVEKVIQEIGNYSRKIERIFIGSGNALHTPQDVLLSSLKLLAEKFNPKRIALYGNSSAIKRKGSEKLQELKDAGLGLIYWGVESGSDKVLKYVCKGSNMKQMLQACEIMNGIDIDLSIMIMPGLGGVRFSDDHIEKTVKLLNSLNVRYITLMGVDPSEDSKYSQIMRNEMIEGKNRPLTDRELVMQTKEILSGLDAKGQRIGIYGPEVHSVGINPVTMNLNFTIEGKKVAMKSLDKYLKDDSQ